MKKVKTYNLKGFEPKSFSLIKEREAKEWLPRINKEKMTHIGQIDLSITCLEDIREVYQDQNGTLYAETYLSGGLWDLIPFDLIEY